MKRTILFFLILVSNIYSQKSVGNSDYPISSVGIRDVILSDSFWLPKIQLLQDTTIYFALNKCKQEGRMQNFLVAGGKLKGSYIGKMPFDDTDLYKIIEGASYSLISKPNPNLSSYLDSLIAIIKYGQEKDGYITTWFTIDRQRPPAWWVKPSTNRWENEVSSHELYNSGHLFEAASAHYSATGKRNFLDIAIKNADLLVENFGYDKLKSPPGHQIVETGLLKLYHITHNEKYLKLAKYFLDIRGDSTTHKLYGAYSQDHLPVVNQDEAVGHAVRALYMYAGMTDIAAYLNDKDYLNAVNKIWDNVVNKKTYITGGLGSTREGEAFGKNYELPNLTAYNETCAAIGSVYWNHRLFLLTGDSRYYDVIERTMYNGLISGISLDGKKFFYPNPTESDGETKFNMGSCTRQGWFDCSCCPTNMIRFLPSLPGLVYATHKDSLYVNLFVSNNSHLDLDGKKIAVSQRTEYPWNGKIEINIDSEQEKMFTLKIRIPGWALNKPLPGDLYSYQNEYQGKISIQVNGKEQSLIPKDGYVQITKTWGKKDIIELTLPMFVRKVTANENVKEDSAKVAFEYGPIVYCAEEVDNNSISDIGIDQSTDLIPEYENLLSEKVIVLKNQSSKNKFTLIPYYLWSNRGVGKMKVWFPIIK